MERHKGMERWQGMEKYQVMVRCQGMEQCDKHLEYTVLQAVKLLFKS